MIMAAWKLGPALAAGYSVVLKPSEKSPLTALRLAELALDAGLPEGVFNVVPGYGAEAGEALALHMDVDAIGFTGSHARRPAHARVRRPQQPETRLQRARRQVGVRRLRRLRRHRTCGEDRRCKRVLQPGRELRRANSRDRPRAHRRASSCASLQAVAPQYQPADPLDPGTEMGAMVDETQLRTVLGYIDAGRSEGAALVAGGGARCARQRRLLRRADRVRSRAQRDEDRARGDLRPGARHHPLQRRGRSDRASPTTRPTACTPASGPAGSTARTASRVRCGPAPCT